MNRHDSDLARRLYASVPNVDLMLVRLPDAGESLRNAFIDLAKDCTLARVDELLMKLKASETGLMHLRRAMAEGRTG